MIQEERVFRARVADFVAEASFPADRAGIVAQARRGNVPSDVLSLLLRIPDRRFSSLSEVLAEIDRLRQAPQ